MNGFLCVLVLTLESLVYQDFILRLKVRIRLETLGDRGVHFLLTITVESDDTTPHLPDCVRFGSCILILSTVHMYAKKEK